MPIIKSAKKKLRQDKKRRILNLGYKKKYKDLLKEAKTNKNTENIKKAVSSIDKAVKKGIIHANKAARLKSQITKKTK
ncbi:hypothetical protein A3C23_03130 [Candidatus Roizmanbacteria bacterium RIFCSPHIGHO2_02_FULL_37_13b]|uniref:Small ribosomal subunit protein bS20 n=1 Tax=Candidatus Roizmanbacteria bacterium RIFCSPLOWO2_02_FULL_36_11 TaxID=1802071 RepID=A0A1F7JIA0_9BACT|nr:MAG: hypothetical protein A3C23_03130 [Candidatus Roizmanbacteria bacterium RIFCSPHIGHO2_02_FULL_37_13b]OGK55344.1 MAG: hypothetical protein A3H78_04565 [Candidatus Roizmanbacteria bacterium RIFCSPLOWO2_02_FULL_36_11]